MGKNTYESIPKKSRPLPHRKNIVLSRSLKQEEGIYLARNIEEALKLAEEKNTYIIGGEKIYKEFLPLINRIELTRIQRNYEGNTFPQRLIGKNGN